MESLMDATSGGLAGAVSSATVYPIEVIKTNLQAQKTRTTPGGPPPRTIMEIVRDLVKRDGVAGLYGGCHVAAMQAFLEKFIYFYTYSALKRTYARLIGAVSLPVSLLLGYCSDWSHLLVTMPAEQVAVRMQTTGVGALTALRQIAEEGPGGLRSFYSGIAAYVVLALKPAIQNAVFESLRRRLLERSARTAGKVARELSAAQAFALGAVARAVATLLVFPCTRAKVLLMTRAAAGAGTPAPVTPPRPSPAAGGGRDGGGSGEGSRPVPVAGLREVLLQVVREEGVLALYHGIRPELVKGVLSASVMLMAKEKIAAANRRIFEAAASRAGRSAE